MVKSKTQIGIPKWIQENPSDTYKKLFRSKAYPYLEELALKGDKLESSTAQIPGFIAHLSQTDQEFGKIKPAHIVTTHKLIEAIRLELKNNIVKIKKDI